MEDFISIAQIKNNLLEWNESLSNINDMPLEQAYLLMKRYLPYFHHIQFSDTLYPMTIYRARIIDRDSTEDISNPRTFSFPPKEKCKTYQRASVPGFPVFYGAMDAKTAIEELRTNSVQPIKKGDQFYLSEWKINKNVLCTFNCLTFSDIIGDQYLISGITERVNQALNILLSSTPAAFKEAQIYLYNQISQLFLIGKYLQSGPIAYQILYGEDNSTDKKSDGILYPSCSNQFNSINCALLPDFVRKHMHMEVVHKMAFEHFEDDSAHSLGHYFGTIVDDKIEWKTYLTEFFGEYTMSLDLTIKWMDKTIEDAAFFVRGQGMNLTRFCESLIDDINFEAISISGEHEERYKNNGQLALDFTFDMSRENCYLKHNDEINPVKRLLLTIPANTSAKSVAADLVRGK